MPAKRKASPRPEPAKRRSPWDAGTGNAAAAPAAPAAPPRPATAAAAAGGDGPGDGGAAAEPEPAAHSPKAPLENPNAALCDILLQMGKIERDQGAVFKWKAYRTAADSLRALGRPVRSGAEAARLPGVGSKIAAKIDEVVATGELAELKAYRASPEVAALQAFTAVSGIGPKKAQELVDKGYRTVAELAASKEAWSAHQRIGLRHFDDLRDRIPFDEVQRHVAVVREAAARLDRRLTVTVCGSHRRRRPTSGDIDCLLTHPLSHSGSGAEYVYLPRLARALRDRGFVVDTISEGAKKMFGVSRLPAAEGAPPCRARRLDLSWYPYDCYWPAVLHFTGSAVFNTEMRLIAIKKGLTLNEYGLYRVDAKGNKGEQLEVGSEEDVFRHLGMEYVAPEDRDK